MNPLKDCDICGCRHHEGSNSWYYCQIDSAYRRVVPNTSFETATGTTENVPGLPPENKYMRAVHFRIVAEQVIDRDCEKEYYPGHDTLKSYRCRVCGRWVETWEIHVHHVSPRSRGGSHHPLNLRAMCRDCHVEEHRRIGI